MDYKNGEHLQDFSDPLISKYKKPVIVELRTDKKNRKRKNNDKFNINAKDSMQTGLRSNASTYSILPISEVTQGAVEAWATLPHEIRQDPLLASFRQEHERIHGGVLAVNDQDPLSSGEVSGKDEDSNECTTINVKNEHGLKNQDPLRNCDHTEPIGLVDQTGDTTNETEEAETKTSHTYLKGIKIALLVALWILFTGILMSTDEKVLKHHQLSISANETKYYVLNERPSEPRLGVTLHGAFVDETSNSTNFLFIQVQLLHKDVNDNATRSSLGYIVNNFNVYKVPFIQNMEEIDVVPDVKKSHTFELNHEMFEQISLNNTILRLRIHSNLPISTGVRLTYDPTPIDKSLGIIYASIVLLGLYVMIIWEIIHRTFATMIASTMSIALLAHMNERPTMPEIMSWIDVETLLLLFGMMILVAILSETGIFDYLAVYAFKITKGQVWPLIYCLCLFTGIVSAFLDNVTTVLLMTPVTIRLCEVMQLNPVPILMSMAIFSNIGGGMTPVGDPPNVIISSNSYIIKNGINFVNFTIHMSVGIVFVMVQTFIQLRYIFRNMNDLRFAEPQDIQELRHVIAIWQRAAASLSSYSKDEDLVRETLLKKVHRLQRQLKKKISSGFTVSRDSYKQTLESLEKKYPIRNWTLLIKSFATLVFVISFFFLHSFPNIQRLSLGWTALLGATLLLILADDGDMESILARVEWATLLFFAALFVLMESLAKLGLIEWFGTQTENVILAVNEEYRLTVAILIILWVTAIASAFVDNIPLTTMMIKVSISLVEKKALNLPLHPLVWALALGGSLGGNGTLIGTTANIVTASIAEAHGYKFSFMDYFKVGFPVMIGGIIVSTAYLLVCHVCFSWH